MTLLTTHNCSEDSEKPLRKLLLISCRLTEAHTTIPNKSNALHLKINPKTWANRWNKLNEKKNKEEKEKNNTPRCGKTLQKLLYISAIIKMRIKYSKVIRVHE